MTVKDHWTFISNKTLEILEPDGFNTDETLKEIEWEEIRQLD